MLWRPYRNTMRLKIYAYATEYFMQTYSKGLQNDCEKFGYNLKLETVPAGSFSTLNHSIHIKMLDVVKNAPDDERILFLDPECRIHKPIPEDWLNDARPIVCYKILDGKNDIEKYTYGQYLPNPILMQPIFLTNQDWKWIKWWFDVSLAGSDPANRQFVPHELFLELALKYNKIDAVKKLCIYNRNYTKGPHEVVKGSWTTSDTVITHPALQGVMDPQIKHANVERKESLVLDRRELHNHFQDFDMVKLIDDLMLKEKLVGWPKQAKFVDGWYHIDSWQFNPKTGKVKHNDYPLTKYHYHVKTKLTRGIKTPVTSSFSHDTSLV